MLPNASPGRDRANLPTIVGTPCSAPRSSACLSEKLELVEVVKRNLFWCPLSVAMLLALAVAIAVAPRREQAKQQLQPQQLQPQLANFTILSNPIDIRYAESFHQSSTFPLPADVVARYEHGTGRQMAVAGILFDVVRFVNDAEVAVPLHDAYVHHAKVGMSRADGVGDELIFGTGSDFRKTPTMLPYPLRIRPAANSTHLSIEVHLINLRRNGTVPWDGELSPLRECPLTPQTKLRLEDNWNASQVAGDCSDELLDEPNPSCALQTYVGGAVACRGIGSMEEGNRLMLIDTSTCAQPDCSEHPRERFYFKTTVLYEDETAGMTPIAVSSRQHAICCDPTQIHGEYDVRPCAAGTPAAACIHQLDVLHSGPSYRYGAPDFIEIAFAKPHVHTGALSIELLDSANRSLCSLSRANGGLVYGTGLEAGNEKGYLVGMGVCSWNRNAAPRIRRGDSLRVRTVYDASEYRIGVMAQFALSLFL